ncbi:M23 family metallopeptidase [Paenibacillus filicis]|uniref:M23 family metallopeptidase n=1 Tax=Paenibacillus gyeongsangnamensis TaxID=3388067 RepID=A0ABT4Q8Z8_9BACL|nr:M23 family metallopeptidase [Paenibacillus filicis]MCZ8513353.1 M23 family metallopeptidase [Paenibacillus filicis]
MDSKRSIRERRMEKIRHLQDGQGRTPLEAERSHFHFPMVQERGRESELAAYRETRHQPHEAYSSDPETEWNRKWQQDLSAYSRSPGYRTKEPRSGRVARQLVISGLLTAMIWGWFHFQLPWSEEGKRYIRSALNESFDAKALAAWYERKFGGSPSFLPAMDPLKHQEAEKVSAESKHYFVPLQGKVIAAFTPGQSGILVQARPGAPVAALDTGRVTFAGVKEDSGFTVVLRHTNGMESVYGHLEAGKVQVNDWIKGGETVGTLSKAQGPASGTLFFALSKDGRPLNPTDVISFD